MIRVIRIILIALAALAGILAIFEATRPYRQSSQVDDYIDGLLQRGAHGAEAADDYQPVYFLLPSGAETDGYMLVTEERGNYKDGDMALIIPSLDFSQPIRAGTTQADLRIGPGLFESSGMPGEAGGNVSIAAHRTLDMFLYLDRLGDGDRVHIVYGSYVYTYVFYDNNVVLPSDWSVISAQGFDSCTLITCTPIGVSDRRLVVRFKLESVS